MLYHEPRQDEPNWWREIPWVSDRHLIRNSRPSRKPSYRQGERLVLYLVGPSVCPAIVEVTREPRFDPERVENEGLPGDAEKWGWLIEVRVLRTTTLVRAPRLHDLGVASSSVRQHGHIRLNRTQYDRALSEIVG